MENPHIAFLGLGIMGAGMAARLLATGHSVTVYNRDIRKAEPLTAVGAKTAATPRKAVRGAEVVFAMVAHDEASRSLWLGENGAVASLAPGTVCIESSTLTVGWIRELAAAVTARGGEFLDCPVTGSKAQLPTGELKFLVGGNADTLDRVRPILGAMATDIIHLGPVGSGILLKLVNNSLNGVQIAAFAEALNLVERSGIDTAKAVAVITNGASGSPMVKTVAARMTAQDYSPHFHLELLAKDLDYAIAEGQRRTHHLTLAEAALACFRQAVAAGLGHKDMSAVVEPVRRNGTQP